MSKSLSKFEYFGEVKSLQSKIKVLGKNARRIAKCKEVNTTGLKSPEIDIQVVGAYGELSNEELNGITISDPVNNLLLIRQNNLWRKIKTESI